MNKGYLKGTQFKLPTAHVDHSKHHYSDTGFVHDVITAKN